MSDEEEYEIESILEARVEKGRKRKLVWKFRVRWKGYSPEDDTWEPIENMTGSEEAMKHFWERINTSGRNYRDLEQFKAGEVFLPVGPPKKRKGKIKEKSREKTPVKDTQPGEEVIEATPEPEHNSPSRIRKRDYDDATTEDNHSSKRPRSTLQPFSSKPNLLLTDAGSPTKDIAVEASFLGSPSQEQPQGVKPPQPETTDDWLNFKDAADIGLPIPTKSDVRGTDISKVSSVRNVQPTTPLHRARIAYPLVKILQDHHTSSLESHGANKSNGGSAPAKEASPRARKRSKPGPGRSSDGLLIRSTLLTSEKGKLKSIKTSKLGSLAGRTGSEDEGVSEGAEMAIDQGTHEVPPKPEELLQLAGLDSGSATLPDYEDECGVMPAPNEHTSESVKSELSLTLRESLFPSSVSNLEMNQTWDRSTIFGPLGLGTDTSGVDTSTSTDGSSMPFQVNLDSSISVPILLVDTVSSSVFPKFALSQRGPPGKFYRGSYAVDLLGTLRTKGSFARVKLSPDATKVYGVNFGLFVKRLSDELFVAMVDQDLLAFCSSTNTLFTQRLNIPSSLLSVEAVLVAHVSIENHSAFADAAINADNTMWSQYILSVGDA